MSLLLKTGSCPPPDTDEALLVSVSITKSVRDLGPDDVGSDVYIWVTDHGAELSHLEMKARLLEVQQTRVPQKREPAKTIAGYRVRLRPLCSVIRPLRTEDLLAFRTDDATSPMYELGRLHADRHEKIIRLGEWTVGVLEARFRRGI